MTERSDAPPNRIRKVSIHHTGAVTITRENGAEGYPDSKVAEQVLNDYFQALLSETAPTNRLPANRHSDCKNKCQADPKWPCGDECAALPDECDEASSAVCVAVAPEVHQIETKRLAQDMYLTAEGHPAYKLTINNRRIAQLAHAYLELVDPAFLKRLDERPLP